METKYLQTFYWEFRAINIAGKFYNLDMTRQIEYPIYKIATLSLEDIKGLSLQEQRYLSILNENPKVLNEMVADKVEYLNNGITLKRIGSYVIGTNSIHGKFEVPKKLFIPKKYWGIKVPYREIFWEE